MTGLAASSGRAGGEAHCAVFLSYARDDQKRALPIVEALRGAGFTVWWDGMIGGGERFLPTTTEAALYAAGNSLTEAAHEAGFADSAHFSRTFRRTFGLPAVGLRLHHG